MQPSIANLTFGAEFEVVLPAQFSRVSGAAELTRRVGFPIASDYNPPRSGWKVVHDGSVRGAGVALEFVSPPLLGDAGLEQIAAVANALKDMGAMVNQSCGFHVHVGASGLGLDFFKNLIKLYGRYEEVIDSIMPASRRGNGAFYCKSVKLVKPQVVDRALNVTELAREVRRASHADGTRYHKVNLDAFSKHTTVEFRQHSGTVDAEKATNWVVTCLKLVAAAKAGKTGEESAQRIAWDITRLTGKLAYCAHLVNRPQGATNAELKAAYNGVGVFKGARTYLKKAGLPYRVAKVAGVETFFAIDTQGATVAAPHPVTLEGLADLIEADSAHREYLARRRAATNPTR